jgi:hypothetical protein
MCFEQSLNDEHLRDFLRRLPDFEDMEAEERAYGYAHDFPRRPPCSRFFLTLAVTSRGRQA